MRATAFAALCFLFVSCKRESTQQPPEVPVTKKVTYNLFAARDYNGTLVENVTAEVRLQLRIINYKTGEQKLVWDSLAPKRRLADFPLFDNKLIVEKTWPVLNSHQKLNGSYSVVYRDGNTINQVGSSDEAVPGINAITLDVDL